MFDTSKDVLNLVIAFSVLLFTVFIVWLLWYLIRMLRDSSAMVHEAREKIEQIGDILTTIKDKLNASASTVAVATKAVSEIMSFVKRRRDKRDEKSTKGKANSRRDE